MPIPETIADKLSQLPQAKYVADLMGGSFNGVISAADAAQLLADTGYSVQELMLDLAGVAALYALPVISGYHVGAIAEGIRPAGAPIGALYYGANMEFSGQALSFTVHAEQSATVNAWQNGEPGLTSLAVNEAPCGYCRQFLRELSTASTLTVYLTGQDPMPLKALLPFAFVLGTDGTLMTPQNHNLTLQKPTSDPVVVGALRAADQCYAPYTSGFAGVAVLTKSRKVYVGRYGENGAYNPSISPLESALTMWNFAGDRTDTVTRCVLVEKVSPSDQRGATSAVASAFAGLAPEFWLTV